MAKRQYKTITVHNHPRATSNDQVLEHIVVAEQKLGRMLNPGETVHHIDGNKLNNSPDNLMVFATNGDHTSFHNGVEIYQDGDVWRAVHNELQCDFCGKIFYTNNQRRLNKSKHYCSVPCVARANRKTAETEDMVAMLFKENGNFTKVSLMFNVTDVAIKHRLQHAGLPFHSRDYKQKQ